jgi:hypothetical protein
MFHRKSQSQLVMPILSSGRHRNPRQGACFMEFASYLAGERWSDHPECTHPLLAALARDVNDLTSDGKRDRLMPLIHRVVGLSSADPLFGATIAVRAAAAAIPIASLERQRALGAGVLSVLAEVQSDHLHELADEAFAQAPDAERWGMRYLASTSLPRRAGERAGAAMVHTAVVGIALACVPDADDRLLQLLESAIVDAEALVDRPDGVIPAPLQLTLA